MKTDLRNYAHEARRILEERTHPWLSHEHGRALLDVIDSQSVAIAELQEALRVACDVVGGPMVES